MKILYVTTVSNTVNAFLVPHIRLLVELGHQVDIACNFVQKVKSELVELGCEFHQIDFQRSPLKIDNVLAYGHLKKIVLNGGYSVVHTHTPVASFITRLACRNLRGVKVLYTAHGFHFYKGAPKKNWMLYYTMEKIGARWTDGIITINEEDYYSASNMKLRRKDAVYKLDGVGIDLNKFISQTDSSKSQLRAQYGYNQDDFILFYAAELNWNKHQDLLINAVYRLKDKIPGIKLLLAGVGELSEYYFKQVNRLGLSNHVFFLGHRWDVPELLQLSDVAVSASRREGLPVNIMEAMATGLPLVVTDSRGNRDLVKNNENGFVVGINDIDGFTNSVHKINQSIDTKRRFSEESQAKIRLYTKNRVVQELRLIYMKYL